MRREVVHEENVLELGIGDLVDVEFFGQVSLEPAVDVLDGALLPGGIGIAEPGGKIEGSNYKYGAQKITFNISLHWIYVIFPCI